MGRLRKTARIWKRPGAREAAGSAMVAFQESVCAIDPGRIFGRIAPLEVELGSGKGEFIVAQAAKHPERNFLAVELSGVVAGILAIRCGRAGLDNLKVTRMDARTLVNLMLEPGAVSAYHIYFPDPWPKERHHKHRLFTPYFVSNLARTLAPEGSVYIATDVAEYAAEIFPMLEADGFRRTPQPIPGRDQTGFARKSLAAGKIVHSAALRR